MALRALDIADVLQDGHSFLIREARQEMLHDECVHICVLDLLRPGFPDLGCHKL